MSFFIQITQVAQAAEVPLPSQPQLSARAAIVVDADTGRVLYAKNPHQPLPMASTTKIMTALTLFSIPGINLEDTVTIIDEDRVPEKSLGLWVGQTLQVKHLLYGMLLDSANDAATALARYGGLKLAPAAYDPVSVFVAEMNRQATKLNLNNTHFANPHGLDAAGHFTSAYDLAVMGWYALQNPVIAEIVRQTGIKIDGFEFVNEANFIRRYPGATGIKPGETDNAGLCIAASATKNGRNAIVVLLNSPDMRTETDQLMDYAFAQMPRFNAGTPADAKFEPPFLSIPTRFGAGLFWQTWAYSDLPVAQRQTARSWYWGVQPLASFYEPYTEAPGQQRLVQYFDKARMEINDPAQPVVSNGLLVVEMINGRVQQGAGTFAEKAPAQIPLAGDPTNTWPTYASLGEIYLKPQNYDAGQPILTAWLPEGKQAQAAFGGDPLTKVATVQNGLGIPAAFWQFLNRSGPVFNADGKTSEAVVSQWLFSTGLPITEAYWTKVRVGGVEKDVLFQAFERRVLTYTPGNSPDYRVEMGNVGQHYLAWRYAGQMPATALNVTTPDLKEFITPVKLWDMLFENLD